METNNHEKLKLKAMTNTHPDGTGFTIYFDRQKTRLPSLRVRSENLQITEDGSFLVIKNAFELHTGNILRYIPRKGWFSCDVLDFSKKIKYLKLYGTDPSDPLWVATRTIMDMKEIAFDYVKSLYWSYEQYATYCRRINKIAWYSPWLVDKIYNPSTCFSPEYYGFILDKELYNYVKSPKKSV